MGSPSEVRDVLEQFIDDLDDKLSGQRLEEVLRGDDTPIGAELGSQPEPWTRRHLIRPLIEACDLYWEPEIHGGGEGYPDFGITNLDVKVIGEDKSLNNQDQAEEEIEEYLNNRAASQGAEYGIATDGITWQLIRIELGGDYLDYDTIQPTPIDFRQELLKIASQKSSISYTGVSEVDLDEKAEEFFETFEQESFNQLLTKEAPKQIRDKKKAGIEEFYDLYVQLLFGEGSRDYDYDTTLIDTIQAPNEATNTDKRKFAIKLVNRLLFVRFLEDNGVLPENFLAERVEKYQEASEVDQLTGGLYKTQIEPIFFSLFNTEKDDRISKHKGGWFDKVEYLNGSLFAPEEDERRYDVDDFMLIRTVRDLVEGHELEEENGEGIDPAVLGQVFEMTINHINVGDVEEDEEQSQKNEGAYYTPSDVIRVVNKQSVDPKIREILTDVYAQRISGPNLSHDAAVDIIEDYELGEMLREIEQREGYFSDPEAIQEAYDRLGDLKLIDPACGSGHFLTGVFQEIHRVRMSLLRGLEGDNLDGERIYKSKKDLVLNSVYGVDINPIAIEIAKLRVWLKMVEDGWERSYGELPNIDINIVDGNSLIGLPARSEGQSVIQAFDIELESIQSVRDEYKAGEIDRLELDQRIEDLKPELRQHFLDQINHTFDERIESRETWNQITESLDKLFPKIQKITVRREDTEELSDEQKSKLDGLGFRIEPRAEKSAKVEEENIDDISKDLGELLEDGFLFDLVRQPVQYDLEELDSLGEDPERSDLSYHPFHWPVEFPEAVTSNGNGYEVNFDIVVGNPPYGDIMSDIERRFTDGYKSGSLNDVVMQFIERQIQILGDFGTFGNIVTLRWAYQKNANTVRDILRENLENCRSACFTTRPGQVFDSSEPRVSITTGKMNSVGRNGEEHELYTSRFIRFKEEDRAERLSNIEYCSTDGVVLGEEIDDGQDFSLPKVGSETAKGVLRTLAENSDHVFSDKMERGSSNQTQWTVWRNYHPRYWINPCIENIYDLNGMDKSRDFQAMYFDSELDRDAAFLIMQSSLYYFYWMVYENQLDLNWGTVDAFPFPDQDDLEQDSEKIHELADVIWEGMKTRYKPDAGLKGEFQDIGALKPLLDKVDEIFGPMFGLDDEQVEFVQNYDIEYRLADVDQTQLVTPDLDYEQD
jgi:type I restriction-modification system DNA methylase subunit